MLRVVVVVALLGLFGVLAPAARAFDQARPMGLYATGSGAPLAMIESKVAVTVRGPIVETVVVQRFHNASPAATEATYIFPLPADAAVSAMAIRIGARDIRAAIEPRDAAQQRYEAAIAAGVPAARLDQERPDVFTQNVAVVPGQATVEITLRYDTLARYQAGTWQLVLPMVVAPRAVPGAASGQATTGSGRAPDTDRAPDASRVTPAAAPGAGGPTTVTIHFSDEVSALTSPSHALVGGVRDATLVDAHSDHDAIVRWKAAAPSAGWVERAADGSGFAAVVVEAPPAPASRRPARVILAIDRAATTRGDGDLVARPLVRALLDGLGAGDRVRVIGSVTTGWLSPDDARAAIERAPAAPFDLTRTLAGARPDGAPIVVVSDGLVADDPAAIAAARRLAAPVHAIGIGPAPARATLTQLAAASGGTVRFAVPGDDLAGLARDVLTDAATPPAPLAITWGTLAARDVAPVALPRLGTGQAMIAFARVAHAQAANARVRGDVFAFEALAPPRPVDGALTTSGPLARRWARERLGDLIASQRDRGEITKLALAYGLVSPYTSLVAIGTETVVRGGVRHSVAVPVSLPTGMRWAAVKQAIDRDTGVASEGPRAPGEREQAAAPPPATPAPAPSKKRSEEEDARMHRRPAPKQPAPDAASDDHDAAERARQAPADAPAPATSTAGGAAEPPAPIAVTGAAPPRSAVLDEETVVPEGRLARTEAIAISGAGRPWRLSAGLGGGLAFDHGTHGLLRLDARFEHGYRTRLGAEAALWLVDGDAQARVLATLARGLGHGLAIGVGAGVHVGADTGVAAGLRLRLPTPLPWLDGVLRYDAAVLLTRPRVEAEHAISLGLEIAY